MFSTMERPRQRKRKLMREPVFTATVGPTYEIGELTTKSVVSLLDSLHESFGPGYTFGPEPITEGGIQMLSTPDGPLRRPMLKTARFLIGKRHGRWPFITPNTIEGWRRQPGQEIWNNAEGELYFKAYFGAPVWTPEEVKKLVVSLTEVGFKCKKTRISAKRLRSAGSLGRSYEPPREQ